MTRLLLLAVLLGLLSGCGAPYRVIRQSNPSALRNATAITLSHDRSQAMMGNEPLALYSSRKSDEDRAKLEEVFETMDRNFIAGVTKNLPGVSVVPTTAAPAPGKLRATVKYQRVQQGKYAVVYSEPSLLIAHVEWSVGGSVVDVVEITSSQQATVSTPSILQRMGNCSEQVGAITARYFRDANPQP